ncbi:MAG: nuclear transport factor 2 family protein [Candidatus Riflebacteria bacterium]|nr:nuclear transport factor 2 family protein [Candidatus Riflebacteria bacterium]
MTSKEIILKFWQLMDSNNFESVQEVLSDNFVLDWPQSGERVHGLQNFARINSEYPSHGPWHFTINRIVAGDSDAVSDVSVTDGVQHARALSFFTISAGKITGIVEFWPEPYKAHSDRSHLVEQLENGFGTNK